MGETEANPLLQALENKHSFCFSCLLKVAETCGVKSCSNSVYNLILSKLGTFFEQYLIFQLKKKKSVS